MASSSAQQQQQQQQQQQRSPSSSPGTQSRGRQVPERRVSSPVAEMMDRLRAAKWAPSKEEAKVLKECSSRMKQYGIEGFIAAGLAVWSVTGGLNLLHRLISTAAGAAAGAFYITQFSIRPCMEDIISLDGTRLQQELVAILQEEQAHNKKVRDLLQKYYYLEPLYDDNTQNRPGVTLRKRETIKASMESRDLKEDVQSQDDKHLESEKQIIDAASYKSNALQNHVETHDHDDEAFVDPFSIMGWTESGDAPSDSRNKTFSLQRDRSKMGVKERREYNRKRYLEWEEKRRLNAEE